MSSGCIKRIVKGYSTMDGGGVRLNRIIATPEMDHIDPFFLLDEFRSDNAADYVAGFPMHPHRGIETVTYLLKGRFKHRDSRGGGGLLEAGDVQWMTAGKGIQHEEMPMMEEGLLQGFQLWLNLPKELKWVEPQYRHLKGAELPVYEEKGVKVTILSGEFMGQEGVVGNHVPCDYYDVRLLENANFKIPLQQEHNSFIYVYSGAVKNGNQYIEGGNLAELNPGEDLVVTGESNNAGFLFLAARPHNEPFARGGSFIMNTKEEIRQAFNDFSNGNIG